MDTTAKPGVDFYQYANGGWMKNHPIPADQSRYGAFEQLEEENMKQLRSLFDKAASNKNATKGSIEQKIGDFYFSGMDTVKIEAEGAKPMLDALKQVDAIATSDDIIKAIANIQLTGASPLFGLYAGQDDRNSSMVIAQFGQGGLGLHDRDYYLGEDARSKTLREEYLKYVANMFTLAGSETMAPAEIANKIMAFETALAKEQRTRLELRDPIKNYNKMTLSGLENTAPNVDWKAYFKILGVTATNDINVGQPEYFTAISKIIKNASIEDWKLYLKWNIINNAAPYLSSKFVEEQFHFYGTVFSGREKMKDRWKRVLNETSGSLGEAVGQMYVEKYFPPEAKKKMLDLVGNLKAALNERISKLEWMSDRTKKLAQEKLQKMNVKIGYPDKWIDYSSLDVNRDSYYKNVAAANSFAVKYDLNKIGKPVDRDEWGMTPQTINAYYNPNMNEIVFPAAILQPPFFDLKADDALNYGAIGVVIGHEMTHGFDDQGRQYDASGNLADWWTPEDAQKFKEHVSVLVNQFNKIVMVDTTHVNGELTLGENIADLGGVMISYTAFQTAKTKAPQKEKIDGFSPEQRFFLSFARVWRGNIRDKELMRRIKEDVHSPAKARVNGTLPNVPYFYEAFGIKQGDPLFIPEADRAKIW
jgi:putative endopeptidase